MNRYRPFAIGLFVAASCLLSTFATPATAARPTRFASPSLPAAAPTCTPGTGTATISGSVLLPNSSGAKNTQVELYTTGGDRVDAKIANATGAYSFTNLSAGTYLIRFDPQYVAGAFLDQWYDNKLDLASATPATVAEGGALTGINATLEPGAQISGRVTAGDTAAPLQSVNVQIYDAAGNRVASAYTDATGNYISSPGLRSGSYRVFFSSPTGKPYLAEYYADKADLASAQAIVVTAPTTRTGIDAALAPAARVSGRVTDATTGAGIVNISVTISNNDGYITGSYTDAGGYYTTTTGLASGSYQMAFGPIFDISDYTTQRKSVTVTAPNLLTGVNVALEKGGRVTGRVTDGLGNPLQDITVFVADETNHYQRYVRTDATGVYTAYGLPTNNYTVHFRPSNYLDEYYNDKPDGQLADRIAVTAPNTASGIDAVLAKGGAVSGRVTDAATGTGLSSVAVEIYDLSGDRVETASTDATGQYVTQTVLRAGDYRVKFIPNDNGSACGYAPEFYNHKASSEAADLVRITPPNSATNINAALQPGSNISGRVTAGSGAGVKDVYVQVYDSTGERVADGRTNTAGVYSTAPALPSGSYRVGFFLRSDDVGRYLDEFYDDKTALALSKPITLTAPDPVTGIDAVLAQGGAITGRVTGADTGAGLPYVAVSVENAAGDSVAYASTDSAGDYTTAALPGGNYHVRFDPQGDSGAYAGASYGSAVAVAAPNITPNINVALARGATIAGRVTAADTGTPLPDINVVVYDGSGEAVAWAKTGPDGSYVTKDGFSPGTYRVGFNPYSNAADYAATFYNRKASLAAADSVTVSSATNITGIDAALVKGSLISGSVTDASSGAGLPGVTIEVYDSSGNQVASGYTGPTGVYVTETRLASGSYRVRFAPSGYNELGGYIATFYTGKNTLATASTIELSAPAMRNGIDAVLTRGAQIAGQVLTPGSSSSALGTTGQPGALVTVYDSAGQALATGKTNELGFYETHPGLPNGTYRLSFTPPANTGYSPTFYNGKLTLAEADLLTISAPGVRHDVNGTLLPIRALFLPMAQR